MAVPYLIGTAAPVAGTTTAVITSGVTTLAGDTLVVGASASATATVVSVKDTAGNTYTEAQTATQFPSSVWVAQGQTQPLTPSSQITVTWNATTGRHSAGAIGCSGLLKAIDQVPAAGSASSGTSLSVTSGTLSAAAETAVGFAVYGSAGGPVLTWGAGWTSLWGPLEAGAAQYAGMAYATTTTTSPLTASATISSAAWVMFLLTWADFAVPVVVNQWPLGAIPTYGLEAIGVSNTPGNMLVAFIAWAPGYPGAVSPVSNVADDANDRWVHLGTSPESSLVRCSIWCAPNTRAGPGSNGGASVVSVATSWYVGSFAAVVAEFAGAPQYAVTDFEVSAEDGSDVPLSGTATQPDMVFTVGTGDSPFGLNIFGSFTPLDTVGSGLLVPGWGLFPAGTVSGGFEIPLPHSGHVAGVMAGLQAQPSAPSQPNPSWPALKTEAAFGYEPGNAETVPAWTDISARAIGPAGNAVISAERGRAYELTQPETGELKFMLNNSDGAFTPGNTISPYYPDVALELAARVSAFWGGSFYSVGMGYAERLPQEWPTLPQYGFTPLTATDGIGVLANSALPSALAGDYLIDQPYVYIPCSEEYATGTTVTSEVYGATNSGAAGLTLANLSRVNTIPAVCFNGVARLGSYPTGTGLAYYFLETGLTLGLASAVANSPTGVVGASLLTGLLGDPGGGIGISTLPSSPAGPGWVTGGLFTAPGARYGPDPGLPQMSAGLTVEFWAILPASVPAGFTQTLLRLDGTASPYYYNSSPGRLLITYASGSLSVTAGDYTGGTETFSSTIALQDGNPHFYSVTVAPDGSTGYIVTPYVDGVALTGGATSGVTQLSDVSALGIGAVMGATGAQWLSWNYTIGQAVDFPAVLSATRIAAHYTAGLTANSGDSGPQRAARILAWSGFGLARACDLGSPSPVFGPADQVQGQTASSALYTVAQTDNGMLYCDAAGNVTIRSRANLYNRPVKWYFGDAPVPGGILNANSAFAAGVSPWTALNSATLAQNTAWSHDGTASLQITGNGSAANPGAQSELIPVTAGVTYQTSTWCYSPQGWGQVQASLSWCNAAGSPLSSSAGAVLDLQAQAPMLLPPVTGTAPAGATQARIVLQALGTPAATVQVLFEPVTMFCAEVPSIKPSGFDYDNTFLWNLLTAHQQLSSAYNGSSATAADAGSQQQYFTRGGSSAQIDQTMETTSYQDVLDNVNWSLARYSQPQIRTRALIIDAASAAGNVAVWPTVLGIEQGDVCSVIRRPVGGAVISELGIVQKVQHDIGPSRWVTTILVVPYAPANNVLTSDTNGIIGAAAIPW